MSSNAHDIRERRDPLRILIVSNLFTPHVVGGAEIVAQRQATRFVALGHEVTVFAGSLPGRDELRMFERSELDGLVVWHTPIASFNTEDSFRNARVAEHFLAVVERMQPDVIHFHNVIGLGAHLIPLARRRGIPTLVTLHDLWGVCLRATMLREDGSLCTDAQACAKACLPTMRPHDAADALPTRLRRDYIVWALAHAHALISPSAALAKTYVQADAIDATRLSVISNGIDLSSFRTLKPSPSGQIRFLCLAYLGEHKGIPDLLEAAAMLARDPVLKGRWSLTIVGDGHLRGCVDEQIAKLEDPTAVNAVGRVPHSQVLTLLAQSDVVVLPSRWPENEPVSLLEAIAAGKALLATDVGGVGALIPSAENGTLVPPSEPRSLAQAMKSYVESPETASRQGAANRARSAEFSEDRTVDEVLALYARTLSHRKSSERPRIPLVICAGHPDDLAHEACRDLYQDEATGFASRVRFVWHTWLPADAWGEAVAFWHWGDDLDHAALGQALRWSLPVVASRGCAQAHALKDLLGGVTLVDSAEHARRLFADLPSNHMLLTRSHDAFASADLIATHAPGESFHLPCPDNWL